MMYQIINELTETEKAYFAGFIDGEGCISAKEYRRPKSVNPSVRLNLSIVQADRKFLQKWRNRIGLGNVYLLQPAGKRMNGGSRYVSSWAVYQWRIDNGEAEQVLRAVLPYLDAKKGQAEIALNIRDTFSSGKGSRGELSEETVMLRRQYVEQLIALKHPISKDDASESVR